MNEPAPPPPYSLLNAFATCLGVVMLVLLVGATAAFMLVSWTLERSANRSSIVVDNESGATCSVYLALGRDEQPPVEFRNVPSPVAYDRRPIVTEQGSIYLRTVRVVWLDGEQTFTLDQEVPKGCRMSIYMDERRSIRTSFDHDYHM